MSGDERTSESGRNNGDTSDPKASTALMAKMAQHAQAYDPSAPDDRSLRLDAIRELLTTPGEGEDILLPATIEEWISKYATVFDRKDALCKKQPIPPPPPAGDEAPVPSHHSRRNSDAGSVASDSPDAAIFPWNQDTFVPSAGSIPWTKAAIEAHHSRDNYLKNLRKSTKSLQRSPYRPANVPGSMFSDALSLSYLDYSKLLYSSRSFDASQRKSTQVADGITIQTDDPGAKRPLSSYAEWARCKDIHLDLLEVTYPCLLPSARIYFRYINSLFMDLDSPFQVLCYDAAYRLHLSRTPQLTFGDFNHSVFASLQTKFLARVPSGDDIPPSVAGPDLLERLTSGPPAAKSAKKAQSSDPCRRWNENKCSLPERECRYKHRCQACNGPHRVNDCPSKASGSSASS